MIFHKDQYTLRKTHIRVHYELCTYLKSGIQTQTVSKLKIVCGTHDSYLLKSVYSQNAENIIFTKKRRIVNTLYLKRTCILMGAKTITLPLFK